MNKAEYRRRAEKWNAAGERLVLAGIVLPALTGVLLVVNGFAYLFTGEVWSWIIPGDRWLVAFGLFWFLPWAIASLTLIPLYENEQKAKQ